MSFLLRTVFALATALEKNLEAIAGNNSFEV